MNNILSVLNVLLKTAHEWEVIDRRPCAIKVVRTMMAEATFHSFEAFEKLAQAVRETDDVAYLIVLLGGEAGMRCGEMMALEWKDLDLTKGRLCVARSEKGTRDARSLTSPNCANASAASIPPRAGRGPRTSRSARECVFAKSESSDDSLPKGGRVRHVPLTSRLAEALRGARRSQHARVLLDDDGQPLTQKVVQGIMGAWPGEPGCRKASTSCDTPSARTSPCRAHLHARFRH